MEFLKTYHYPLIGGSVGIALATSILAFGLLKTLFVLICAALGTLAGYILQEASKK